MLHRCVYLSFLMCAAANVSIPRLNELELPSFEHGVDLPVTRPLIIAHRGSSGVFPEHSVRAYEDAVQQGSDVIECDLALTRDLKFICIHSPFLSDVTDVEKHFNSSRKVTYNGTVSGNPFSITDYASMDFTLSEIHQIRLLQAKKFRDPTFDGMFKVPTFSEFMAVVQQAQRPVGVHVELKVPDLVNAHPALTSVNTTMEELLLAELKSYRLENARQPCFLQSFNMNSLRKLKGKTDLPLVFLTHTSPNDQQLADWSKILYGIGPSKILIAPSSAKSPINHTTDLIERCHRYGLKVHAFTFRIEDRYLSWTYRQNFIKEIALFLELKLDGFFTDSPGALKEIFDLLQDEVSTTSGSSKLTGYSASWLVTAILHIYIAWSGCVA